MTVATPTVAAVRVVITTAMDDDAVTAFIEDAALIADLTGIQALAAARQVAIVKWLTAHLIAQHSGKGGQITAESIGDASKSYAGGSGGLFLQATRYGQQACLLDTSGELANLGRASATLELLTTDDC